ncbi:MAG TPA: hypothetical protein PKM63_15230 [Panacibacter sp.]|nr:hypothetical protein [Panacibacter sp.]HNP45642.1 hypothetical protein [Panacibacter sp.]
MKSFLLPFLLLFYVAAISQPKHYIIGVKGDTLNRIDENNLKQGKWVTRVESLRGEPGYEEEGIYKDGKKEGTWRHYSLMGDVLAIENYKWGVKNGKCSYYTLYGIEREESWKATDPENPYDTIEVPDLNTDAVYLRVIKVDASTVKQGVWNYYDPQSGLITKTEEYVMDKLVDPFKKKTTRTSDSTASMTKDTATLAKSKPREVLEYEKKNAKKKIKVRDGATGVQ